MGGHKIKGAMATMDLTTHIKDSADDLWFIANLDNISNLLNLLKDVYFTGV